MNVKFFGLAAGAAAVVLALSGCVPHQSAALDDATKAGVITVDSDAEHCTLSTTTAPSGTLAFRITNRGDQVTEFYLLADDGLRIVSEIENIGPGITRDLVAQVKPGNYFTVCKPGMVGAGVGKASFTVSDSGASLSLGENLDELIAAANTDYKAYVVDQVDQLVTGTNTFAAAYAAGKDDLARSLYASTRVFWERIEPVAESFSDLDSQLDLRETSLETGQEWTGWHAIEKDLWPPSAQPDFQRYSPEKRAALATALVNDTTALSSAVLSLTITFEQQVNGAIGLMDEVATKKVTGEEELWSHTDLWDFQANVEGAQVMYQGVRDILITKDAALATTIDHQFDALRLLLDSHRSGDGFKLYTQLSVGEIKALSDQVNALSEPLNQITATIVAP